jgi:coatomer protein complex subunit alpha (xenin)
VNVIRRVLITTVTTKDEEQKVIETLDITTNNCLAVSMEIKWKTEMNQVQQLQIGVYMTHVNLLPGHMGIVQFSAMCAAYRANNFMTVVQFGECLRDRASDKFTAKAHGWFEAARAKGTNAHEIECNPRNPFTVCAVSFRPGYRGTQSVLTSRSRSARFASYLRSELIVQDFEFPGL